MTELGNDQKAPIAALVKARRRDVVPVDEARVSSFMQQAGGPDRAASATDQFDRLRRARNQDRYQAKPVGAAAADQAEQVARELFEAAVARGVAP